MAQGGAEMYREQDDIVFEDFVQGPDTVSGERVFARAARHPKLMSARWRIGDE